MMVVQSFVHSSGVEYTVVGLDFGQGILMLFRSDTGEESTSVQVWLAAMTYRSNAYFKREGLV